MPDDSPDRDTPLKTLGWAIFLGVSWTWCIGMFLPVLLIRDFGRPGFIVFAIPNVLGAAAFGYMLRSRAASADFLRRHEPAAAAFSLITITFHIYFLVAVLPALLPSWPYWPAIAALFFAAIFLRITRARWRGGIVAAVIAYLLSLAIAIRLGAVDQVLHIPAAGVWDSHVGYLLAICVFGFGLCPYLDLTFHRARLEFGTGAARTTFSLGFGIVFLTMILFSAAYAMAFINQENGHWRQILAAHFAVQSGLTLALHWREIRDIEEGGRLPHTLIIAVTAVFAAILLANFFLPAPLHFCTGETGYRLFLAFYALVFPAYVYLFPHRTPSRRDYIILTIAILLAAPLLYLAFFHDQLINLIPAIGIILASRLMLPRPVVQIQNLKYKI